MTLATEPRAKPCRVCRASFMPPRPMAVVCSLACARRVPVMARNAAKADRKATRARLDEMKPLSHWAKLAQDEVNRYVRLRDAHLPCISCARPAIWDGQWHASHFRSVGAASAVRFNLWNIHKADSVCNNWKSGNLSEYEPRLRARIGDAKVDWLRTQNQTVRYSRDYLQRLARVFRNKASRQERRNARDEQG